MKSTSGLGYTEMAQIQGMREKTLMQRVRRGSFPAPDAGSPRSQEWSREMIALPDFARYLPGDAFIPPHWRGQEAGESTFLGTSPVRTTRGQRAAIIRFRIGGVIAGILFTPIALDDEVHRLRQAGPVHHRLHRSYRIPETTPLGGQEDEFHGCDIIYQPHATVDAQNLPDTEYDISPSLDCWWESTPLDDRHSKDRVWKELARTIGIPLPFWPTNLRRMSDIISWRPDRTEPNEIALVPRDDRHELLSTIERYTVDDDKPSIRAKMEHALRGWHGDSDDVKDHALVQADPELLTIPAVPRPFEAMSESEIALVESEIEMVRLRDDAPISASFLKDAARSLVYEYGRDLSGPSTISDPDERDPEAPRRPVDRLVKMMLESPQSECPEMSRTILGIAHGDERSSWHRLDGSDAYIIRTSNDYPEKPTIQIIQPSIIIGFGNAVEFSLPINSDIPPLFSNDRGHVWPLPTNGSNYTWGYPGGGPSDYAAMILELLTSDFEVSFPRRLDASELRLTDPDSGREFTPIIVNDDPESRPFAGAVELPEVFDRNEAVREFARTGIFS